MNTINSMRPLLLELLLLDRLVGAFLALGVPVRPSSLHPIMSSTTKDGDNESGVASQPPRVLVDPVPPPPDLTYGAWADQTKSTLQSLYYGISAPFCCGGTILVEEPVRVTVRGSNITYVIHPPPVAGTKDAPDVDAAKELVRRQVEQLREFVEQAPTAVFGMGSEEQFDVSVRNGRQLPAADFDTNIDPSVLQSVLRIVQAELGLQVGIEAEPYSINIYEEGGLFESHKDTPRGRDMFGTLVLCLPSLFVGGPLQVGMSPQTTQSFFGQHLDRCEVPYRDNLSGDRPGGAPTGQGRRRRRVAAEARWCRSRGARSFPTPTTASGRSGRGCGSRSRTCSGARTGPPAPTRCRRPAPLRTARARTAPW
jgi:hypothetical protein